MKFTLFLDFRVLLKNNEACELALLIAQLVFKLEV